MTHDPLCVPVSVGHRHPYMKIKKNVWQSRTEKKTTGFFSPHPLTRIFGKPAIEIMSSATKNMVIFHS